MKSKFRFVIWALFLMPIIGVGVFYSMHEPEARVFGTLPTFELDKSNGETLALEDLKGKVWVANFVFTSCTVQCPLLSQKALQLQEKFGKNDMFRIVSFSVDPERDTPAVLEKYGERFGAKPETWHFVTGERPELKRLLEKGFKVVSGDMSSLNEGVVTHSLMFVLVDRWGRIRGYFDSESKRAMRKLRSGVQRLLLERF